MTRRNVSLYSRHSWPVSFFWFYVSFQFDRLFAVNSILCSNVKESNSVQVALAGCRIQPTGFIPHEKLCYSNKVNLLKNYQFKHSNLKVSSGQKSIGIMTSCDVLVWPLHCHIHLSAYILFLIIAFHQQMISASCRLCYK